MTRRHAGRAEEPREVFVGVVERAPRGDYAEGYVRGTLSNVQFAVEQLGYYLTRRPAPSGTGRDALIAVRETPREQALVAEGLARFERACIERPELANRYAATPAGAAA